MEAITSFSQKNEDIILLHALKGVNKNEIFWIDVGANDPVNISVTQLFYMLGGCGINIEPQIMYKERYKKLRERDINLFVGIGEEAGEIVLHGSGDTASMINDNYTTSKMTVPVITLTEVFEKYVIENKTVHFLKIDVEGFEEQCIKGLNLEKYKPWIFCIESIGMDDKTYLGYESLLIENGYVYAYNDGQNRYYVRNDRVEVIERFSEMNQLDKYYDVISMRDVTKWLVYEQSTSWKITAPLRKVFSYLRKC